MAKHTKVSEIGLEVLSGLEFAIQPSNTNTQTSCMRIKHKALGWLLELEFSKTFNTDDYDEARRHADTASIYFDREIEHFSIFTADLRNRDLSFSLCIYCPSVEVSGSRMIRSRSNEFASVYFIKDSNTLDSFHAIVLKYIADAINQLIVAKIEGEVIEKPFRN